MATDLERLTRLESKYEHLMRDFEDERQELHAYMEKDRVLLVALRKELDATNNKINNAESWGRGVLYATLGITGVVTQLGTLTTWLKKLLT